jgi:hypothetical protein
MWLGRARTILMHHWSPKDRVHFVTGDEVWGDIAIGVVIFVVGLAFFLYTFGPHLRRATRLDKGEKRDASD